MKNFSLLMLLFLGACSVENEVPTDDKITLKVQMISHKIAGLIDHFDDFDLFSDITLVKILSPKKYANKENFEIFHDYFVDKGSPWRDKGGIYKFSIKRKYFEESFKQRNHHLYSSVIYFDTISKIK